MKTKSFLFIFLIINITCSGQELHKLNDYLSNHKLDYLSKVESEKNILTLYGYLDKDDSTLVKRKVTLDRHQVLGVKEWSHLFYFKSHYKPLPISITTIPFKVRPELDEFKMNAKAGFTNVGLNFDFARFKLERYFASGKRTTHKFYGGIWLAPSVEELDSIQTRGYLNPNVKSKQLFVSTALTVNYTYNNLTFTFVPIGFDIGTSSTGKKWIYNETRWWGFGIGLEPKFLNTIKNE